MMNPHMPVAPHIPPTAGRRQHEMPYTSPPGQSPYHLYHYHPQAIPSHFHPHPAQQWYQNPAQAPMPRQYQQYSQMITPQYPMMHPAAPPIPRPNPQNIPSSASVRAHMLSPPPPDTRVSPSLSTASRSRPSPPPAPPPITRRMPFYPPLPWYSVSEEDFPTKGFKKRRRRPRPSSTSLPLELPNRVDTPSSWEVSQPETSSTSDIPQTSDTPTPALESAESATPTTSKAPSEAESTHPTTPSSVVAPNPTLKTPTKSINRQPGKLLPVIPIIPHIPSLPRSSKQQSVSVLSEAVKHVEEPKNEENTEKAQDVAAETNVDQEEIPAAEKTPQLSSPPVKAAPKSWADLVRTKAPVNTSNANHIEQSTTSLSKELDIGTNNSLAEVLSSFSVNDRGNANKIAFLKPRGLVNTGNMCYMNSVLQILVFCIPFYTFLDRVGKQAAHSFNSETPLMDALIMFVREFSIIDSATSVEQLRMRLKDDDLEQYGEAFTPEFVYDQIKRLPRFSTMRRGHQQDAEEFLGFLLEELHEECVKRMKATGGKASTLSTPTDEEVKSLSSEQNVGGENGWLEVGPRQKAAITRSSGAVAVESPITKIFGGKLRSELRVPGTKNSVTLEPYQPLQLDIGSPHINNISDALKGLTRMETLHGEFNSPRGPGISATKQVFIETLPPVLILHLKRFQYDNAGGTQKIWKKVGYPLELEIPKDVFPQHRRASLSAQGALPRYRLIGVVYHHGKNASGGHYTVDVRRQDGLEWIRLDDTVIRRVRSEDVAEGGSEEDPKILAAALEQHKKDQGMAKASLEQANEDDDEKLQSDKGWSHVNGGTLNSSGARKWSGVVNGNATPTTSSGKRTPVARYSAKDNKVAYLIFYEKIGF